MWPIALPATSKRLALSLATQNLSTALVSGKFYLLSSNQDLYYNQAGVASAADGNSFVPKGVPVIVNGSNGATIAVIGLVAGDVTISQIDYFLR